MSMKKKEFIERYGIEKYQRQLEKKRQCQKKYYDAHSDEILQKQKERYEANKEEILKQQKEYKDAHKEERNQYQKEYQKTQKGRAACLAAQYNHIDKAKGFDISNNVTKSYILQRIFTSKCIYCGDDNWEHLGCDRIDNSKPHTPDNVVPCCGICNAERSDKKTVEEMIEHRTTKPRTLVTRYSKVEKTPSGAIKKRFFTVVG